MNYFGPIACGLVFGWLLAHAVLFVLSSRKEANGHRQAAGDRDDSDLYAHTSFGAIDPLATQRALFAGYASTFGAPARLETPALKETTAEVPILGHKLATLSWAAGRGFCLTSFASAPVEADADAACHAHDDMFAMFLSTNFGRPKPKPQHDAPELSCRCGFYAVRDPAELTANPSSVRLDVELSGRVIVHEAGYRAQHQRVLRAHSPACFYCGIASTVMWIRESEESVTPRPLCDEHRFMADGSVSAPIEKVMDSIGLPWERA